MQTFHPHMSYELTAKSLDYRRLGKQRVECKQILTALLVRPTGWANHPVTRRWSGHERQLCQYAIAICEEWLARGFRDSLLPYFKEQLSELVFAEYSNDKPNWLTEEFCASHRLLLYRKDSVYYRAWSKEK